MSKDHPFRCTESQLRKVGVTIYCDHTGKLQCRDCGQIWQPMLRRGGKMPRGYWKCPNGCNQ